MQKKEEQIQIQLKLKKVLETGYFFDSALLSSFINLDLLKINIEFGFKIDVDISTNLFILHVLVRYQYPKENELEKILELTSSNYFEIENLDNLIEMSNDEGIKDKANILPTLLGFSISTLRGILVVKTAGTVLADYPLPIVNPTDICKKTSIDKK